jgi:hypothetical protein
MHIVNTIDEMHGGYSLDALISQGGGSNNALSGSNDVLGGSNNVLGGSNDVLSGLFIPFGLYFHNERAENTFFTAHQKAGTIDNKLFDELLDAVSKTKSKPTRKEHAPATNKTKGTRRFS